jgi:hypothetical protein
LPDAAKRNVPAGALKKLIRTERRCVALLRKGSSPGEYKKKSEYNDSGTHELSDKAVLRL